MYIQNKIIVDTVPLSTKVIGHSTTNKNKLEEYFICQNLVVF